MKMVMNTIYLSLFLVCGGLVAGEPIKPDQIIFRCYINVESVEKIFSIDGIEVINTKKLKEFIEESHQPDDDPFGKHPKTPGNYQKITSVKVVKKYIFTLGKVISGKAPEEMKNGPNKDVFTVTQINNITESDFSSNALPKQMILTVFRSGDFENNSIILKSISWPPP